MKWRVRFCIVSAALSAALAAYAAGLSTAFVDVVVEQARLGEPTDVRGPEGKGLVVKNLGDSPVDVSVQALMPTPAQLRPGAVSLPDLTWVRMDPPSVVIPPHGEGQVNVVVSVPRRREFRRRTYQVMLWSRGKAAKREGVQFNAGLLSCLRIRTIP